MVGLMGVWASSVNAQSSPCTVGVDCDNEMLAGTASGAVGSNVIVPLNISKASIAYAGFNGTVEWSDVGAGTIDFSSATYTGLNGMTLDAAPTFTADGGGANLDWLQMGSARLSGTGSATGTAVNMEFTCVAAGTVALRLVPPAGGVDYTSTLGPSGAIETGLTAGQITCFVPADITTAKAGPATAVAGVPFDWVSTVTNTGPGPSNGVIVGDNLPESPPDPQPVGESGGGVASCADTVDNDTDTLVDMADPDCQPASVPQKIVNLVTMTYNGGASVCAPGYQALFIHPVTGLMYSNIVLCSLAAVGHPVMASGDVVVLTVNVTAPLYDAGKLNVNVTQAGSLDPLTPDLNEANEADCAPLGLDPGNLGCAMTQVLPAAISIVKAGPASMSVGDAASYTITLTSTGASPASAVSVSDVVPGIFTLGAPSSTQGTCSVSSQTVTCNVANAVTPMNSTVTITIPFTCATAGSGDNSATVQWADPLTATSNHVITVCTPPFNGMLKDGRPDLAGIQDAVNLWLCKQPNPDCGLRAWDASTGDGPGPMIGKGGLDIADLLSLSPDIDSPNDSDLLPEGLAAYEEQIKYDHKLFDISVADAGADGLDNDQDGMTDEADESVIRGPRGNINCTMTILTENWIMFGCVSSGQQQGMVTPLNKWLKTIHVTPDADMFLRVRPTKDNGVVSELIDENCEVADMYASEPWPDTLPGGLTQDCGGITITTRMLEGDINLDCLVDVNDEQAIAFRYGSSFGLLLYDSFYDLEPKFTDFDIDIKDLQFVFGRDGSSCQAPIPDDQGTPSPAIPDP